LKRAHRWRKRITAFAWAVMLAAALGRVTPSTAQETPVQGSERERARAAMLQGRAGDAIALLRSWLASHPDDLTARIMLGAAYRVAQQPGQAAAEFQETLKISPGNYEALIELGSLDAETGDPGEAEPLLARAARENPRSAAVRIEWAAVLAKLHRYAKASAALRGVPAPAARDEQIAYQRLKAAIDSGMGNTASAAADMERALQLAPEDIALQFAAGVAEDQAGRSTRAIELLEPAFQRTRSPEAGLLLLEAQLGAHQDYRATLAALRAAPQSPEEELRVRLSLAQTLARHQFYAEAARDFEDASSLAPENAGLLYDLALAQLRAGEIVPALQSAQKAKSVEDSASIESLLGEIEEKRSDSLSAVRSFQLAVDLAPGREDVRLRLGLDLLRHEAFQPALVVFKQGAELFPKSFRMRVALGLTYYFLQNSTEAVRTLLEAVTLRTNPAMAFEYLGMVQLQGVQPDAGAVKQLCDYSAGHPNNGESQCYCGALLARLDHDRGTVPRPGALRRLRVAARLLPENGTAHCELGKALDWAHEWLPARQELEACVRLDPNSADAHYLLAGVYRRLGESDLAIKQMQLHVEAAHHMAEANSERAHALKTFLFTMRSSSPY
jgi:tetratricopeptide (TPR) repeat protein